MAVTPMDELLRGLTRDQLVRVIQSMPWPEQALRIEIDRARREGLTAQWHADLAAEEAARLLHRQAMSAAHRPGGMLALRDALDAWTRATAKVRRSYKRLMR